MTDRPLFFNGRPVGTVPSDQVLIRQDDPELEALVARCSEHFADAKLVREPDAGDPHPPGDTVTPSAIERWFEGYGVSVRVKFWEGRRVTVERLVLTKSSIKLAKVPDA